MGDFPRHWCVRDDGFTVVSPMSVLDCDQRDCRRKSDLARRGCYWPMEHIDAMIKDSEEHLDQLRKRLTQWQLVREAKEREVASQH